MSSGLVLPCSSRLTECLGRLPSTTSLSDLRALLSREFGLATAAGGSRELTQEEEAVVFVMETAVKMELQPDELVRQIRQAGLSREWVREGNINQAEFFGE